jgi:hypothetical protein
MERKLKNLFAKVQETFQKVTVATLCTLKRIGSNQSSDEIHVGADANTMFNPLKFKKRSLKVLKKTICYGGILLCLLVLFTFTFASVGCEKPNETVKNDKLNEIISSFTKPNFSVWKCIPDANYTIILAIDSLQDIVYVRTDPQDLNLNSDENGCKWYLFQDKEQFIMHEDTLLENFFYDSAVCYEPLYLKTMLSTDTMKMEFLGILTMAGVPVYITNYLFIRQTLNN